MIIIYRCIPCLVLITGMVFAQYSSEWTSGNLGQYGWGGAYGYDIDGDNLVEFYTRTSGQITFYNGDYSIEWNVSFPGYDYVSVVQPRDIDGDGLVTPLNMDADGAGEIVIIAYYYNTGNNNYYGKFRVYDANTYTLEHESPDIAGFYGNASLEDIDGDMRDELIITRFGSSTSISYVDVYAYSGTGMSEKNMNYSKKISLDCSPNPALSTIAIQFTITNEESPLPLRIRVLDVAGRHVRTLINVATPSPGNHTLTWDGTDAAGNRVSAGSYYVVTEKGNTVSREHIQLLQ